MQGMAGMKVRESSQSIDDQAAAWVARMDRAPLSGEEALELERWLAGDSRRRGAMLRAKAALLHSEAAIALGPGYDPDDFRPASAPPEPVSRRRFLGWGMAAAVGLVCLVMLPAAMRASVAYATERGEMRMVPLGDGSTATLNTATRIRVRYDGAQRLVSLVGGEVWFEVVRDPVRPFVVDVDGQRLVAQGRASFLVRKLDGVPLHVSVHEGLVDLPAAGGAGEAPARLDTSSRALLPASGPRVVTGPLPAAELAREIAWREGKIAFHGESLAEAAAAFDRYSGMRIVVDDDALAGEPVTGLFAANDPVGFGRAISGVFNAEARVVNGQVLIARAH